MLSALFLSAMKALCGVLSRQHIVRSELDAIPEPFVIDGWDVHTFPVERSFFSYLQQKHWPPAVQRAQDPIPGAFHAAATMPTLSREYTHMRSCHGQSGAHKAWFFPGAFSPSV